MATQPVIIDRELTTQNKLTYSTANYPPPPTAEGVAGKSLGNGLVVYYLNVLGTGSAANAPVTITKAHRLVRFEMVVTNTTTGALDATSTNILLKVRENNVSASNNVQLTLFSTNGAQPVDSVVFAGGQGWESENRTYIWTSTVSASDTIFGYLVVQYL